MDPVAFSRNRWVMGCVLCVALAGCKNTGSDQYHVEGVVSYQGKPLPLGLVTFVSDSHRPSDSLIDAEGRYALEAAAGEYKVAVVANQTITGDPAKPSIDIKLDETRPLVPEKYNDYQTSGVVVRVEPSPTNKIDIPLK